MPKLKIRYSSPAQQAAFRAILSGDTRTLLLRGGSGSGKTYIAMLGVLFRAMKYAGTEHYLLKTDKSVLRSSFTTSVLGFLRGVEEFPESESRRDNDTYFWDEAKGELHLANGSVIYLRPIRSPHPKNSRGDAALLGMNAETVYIDEATTIAFDWYEFFETRARSAHGCPPLLLLTENLDARSWSYSYFDQHMNPITGLPLSEEQVSQARVLRIESWENVLQDARYLEVLKASGNAARFYYSQPDDSADYGRIYPYDVAPPKTRLFYVYGMDIGYNAHTAIVQVGFGGDYTTNVREIAYVQGATHDVLVRLVDKVRFLHERIFQTLKLSLPAGMVANMVELNAVPVIVIDCARTDLINDFNRFYNARPRDDGRPFAIFVPSRKAEQKYYSIERVKRFKQIVHPESRNYLNEISNYRYDATPNVEERVPDGHDDLLDAALYAHRYILEELFVQYPHFLLGNPAIDAMRAEFEKIDISKCYHENR